MKIAIGCDHIVTEIKDSIVKMLRADGHKVIDCGTNDKVRTHYPIYGHKVGTLVAKKVVDRGIAICGTGVGISNAANKTRGIRACLVRDILPVKQAVEEFNANVIACGGRVSGLGLIEEICRTFLATKYKPDKEKNERIKKIDALIPHDNYQEDIFAKEMEKWKKRSIPRLNFNLFINYLLQ